jgi:hypothetical protein
MMSTKIKFFDIAIQADSSSTIPPYYELDRADKIVPDIKNVYSIFSLDPMETIKRYFLRLSPRNDKGNMYCSLILAQNISFHDFMDKARSSLMNLDYGIFSKVCDHERTSEIGWLLYSTWQQDEERISELISNLVNAKVGAKWRPICCNDRNHKDPTNPIEQTYALYLEGAEDSALKIRQLLKRWYGSRARKFPDGSKMRLVPPYQSMIAFGQKTKFASLVARQAALSARICTGSTWELTANLVLDYPEPQQGVTLCQILLNIPSNIFHNKPLFHTVDRSWRSQTGITFNFLPENEEDARSFIAGLIPFLKATESPWFMKLFSEEAKLRHLHSRWDSTTKQVFSAEEAELEDLLAEDDEMNKSDETTLQWDSSLVEVNIAQISALEESAELYKDDDSVSIFIPTQSRLSTQPSLSFQPRIISDLTSGNTSNEISPVPTDIKNDSNENISTVSDTESRLSSIENNFEIFQNMPKHRTRSSNFSPNLHSSTGIFLPRLLWLTTHHRYTQLAEPKVLLALVVDPIEVLPSSILGGAVAGEIQYKCNNDEIFGDRIIKKKSDVLRIASKILEASLYVETNSKMMLLDAAFLPMNLTFLE